jgi:hypothetical protein
VGGAAGDQVGIGDPTFGGVEGAGEIDARSLAGSAINVDDGPVFGGGTAVAGYTPVMRHGGNRRTMAPSPNTDDRQATGRRPSVDVDPDLLAALDALIEPLTGDSESPLRWTCGSTRDLAKQLSVQRCQMRDGEARTSVLDSRTIACLFRAIKYKPETRSGSSSVGNGQPVLAATSAARSLSMPE